MIARKLVALAIVLAACSRGPVDAPVDSSTTTSAMTPTTTAVVTTTSAQPTSSRPDTSTTTSTLALPALRPPPLGPGETICDLYGAVRQIGVIEDGALLEISGIAVSRTHRGVTWAVNDSGDGPIVYAVREGSTIATVTLDGVFPIDWEDLDIGPGPDGSDHLFVGDVGDNLGFRPWLSIFRLREPDPSAESDIAATADELELVYPDAEGADTEAIAVDPLTGDILVVPKSRSAVGVYRARADTLDGRVSMERIGTLDLNAEITAAAFSPSGDRLVLRGYKTIWAWPRDTVDLSVVLATTPCEITPATERQGEAITIRPDNAIVTISEGSTPPINLVPASR